MRAILYMCVTFLISTLTEFVDHVNCSPAYAQWANERDETDEMIRLLHRLIAKVGDGYDGQYTRQKNGEQKTEELHQQRVRKPTYQKGLCDEACERGSVQELTDSSGTIRSPCYAENRYPDDVRCQWLIRVPAETTVSITFSELHIESGEDCAFDSVTVYNGSAADDEAALLGRYCGDRLPQTLAVSSSSAVLVVFLSDFDTNDGRFALSWKFNEPDPCVSNFVVEKLEQNGTVRFPLTGTNYPNNAACRWRIIAPVGKVIRLTFEKIDVEQWRWTGLQSGSGDEELEICAYDRLSIFDGADDRSPTIGVYCGTRTPQQLVQSTGTQLFLAFVSDSQVAGEGFVVDWHAVDDADPVPDEPSCGRPGITPSLTPATGRIVGGTEARAHSWPWQCSIRYKYSYVGGSPWGQWCGASVLSRHHVLTAAHCLFDHKLKISNGQLKVICGDHNQKILTDPSYQQKFIQSVDVHESYSISGKEFDIAVIHLRSQLTFNANVQPICLPKLSVTAGTQCVATGWGYTAAVGAEFSSVLRQVVVPIMSQTQCAHPKFYGNVITDNMLCAGYLAGGRDSCQGDSGGPLVCHVGGRWWLHGVVGFGSRCARPLHPGVYTRVTKFVDWIHSRTATSIST